MANAFITQRIYQSGDTPQPTPTPTSSNPVKVWKAWQIGDTDFFIGVGQAVQNIGKGIYIQGDVEWNDCYSYYGYLSAIQVWGHIENNQAKTIYECNITTTESPLLNWNVRKKKFIQYIDSEVNNVQPYRGGYNNGTAWGISGHITIKDQDNKEFTAAFFRSHPILIIDLPTEQDPSFFYPSTSTVKDNISINYPTKEESYQFIKQIAASPPTTFSPIDIDPSIQGTLFNGLVPDPT